MASLGIRIEGVASQIGAMGGKSFRIDKKDLIEGLCIRYGASKDAAEDAIYRAVKAGAVTVKEGVVILMMHDKSS